MCDGESCPAALTSPPVEGRRASLGQLDQNAGRRLGVNEGNAVSSCPETRGLIDQVVAVETATLQGGIQIGNAVAEVMNTWPSASEELRDGAIRIHRLEQFDRGRTEGE